MVKELRKIFARGVERREVCLPDKVTVPSRPGEKVLRGELLVFDYMPPIVADQYRTNSTLLRYLFRDPPVSAPFILTNEAYTLYGQRALDEGRVDVAAECFRIALDAQTSFANFMASHQNIVMLSEDERKHLRTNHPLGTEIEKVLSSGGAKLDEEAYKAWIERVRGKNKGWKRLNRESYRSIEYIDACLQTGRFREAGCIILGAFQNGLLTKGERDELTARIESLTPPEILDVEGLSGYIEDNFPESTFGQ